MNRTSVVDNTNEGVVIKNKNWNNHTRENVHLHPSMKPQCQKSQSLLENKNRR